LNGKNHKFNMKSLDPRINRLKLPEKWDTEINKSPLDQFGTWEVFHQRKEGIPYTYVGPVHAPNQDMAFLFAKEQYSRRYTCSGLWIVNTQNVFVTEYTDSEENIYDKFTGKGIPDGAAGSEQFEIFHLNKRGKQHVHACNVKAGNYESAIFEAKKLILSLANGGEESPNKKAPTLNIWVIKTSDILFSNDEDKDIWNTVSEKKYRDAIAYKSMDKINRFKEERRKSDSSSRQ